MYIGEYNSIPSLYVLLEDPDSADLESIGFKKMPKYWEYEVPNKNAGLKVLNRLKKKFEIPKASEDGKVLNEDSVLAVLQDMQDNKFAVKFPSAKAINWFRIAKFKPVKKGRLKIYPLVVNGKVSLVVDAKSHQGIDLSSYGFQKNDEYCIYLAKNVGELKNVVKEVSKVLEITNLSDLKKSAKKKFNITL